MSEFVAIVAVWSVLLLVPTLGVVAANTRGRTGRWPWEYGVGVGEAGSAMTALVTARGHEYLGGWVADWREGEVPWRIAAFLVSFGLLYRGAIHSLVGALSYPEGPPGEVDYGLGWTPLQMDRTPLWTARVLTAGSGVVLAYMTGWPVWGWPPWAAWTARVYLFAQVGVWVAEPIAIMRDYYATE